MKKASADALAFFIYVRLRIYNEYPANVAMW